MTKKVRCPVATLFSMATLILLSIFLRTIIILKRFTISSYTSVQSTRDECIKSFHARHKNHTKNEIPPIIPAAEHFGNFPDEILILLHSIAKVLECYPNSGKTFNLIRAGKNRKKQTACLLFKRKHVYLFFIFNPNETFFFFGKKSNFFQILQTLHDLHKLLDYFYSYLITINAYSLQYDVCSESQPRKCSFL